MITIEITDFEIPKMAHFVINQLLVRSLRGDNLINELPVNLIDSSEFGNKSNIND